MPASCPQILVVRRRYLGDLVLLGPLLRNLRLHWPEARIAVLAEPAYAPVLALNPDVDEVLTLPGGPSAWGRLLRRLRGAGFTHVFDLDNTEKTAVLARWTGAGFRAALRHELPPRLPRLYTHLVLDPPADHERRSIDEYYLQVLPAAGVPVISRAVRLVPPAAELAATRRHVPEPGPRLLVHPGTRSPFRQWPAECFAAVCERVHTELGIRIVLTGGPGEQGLVADIQRRAPAAGAAVVPPLAVPAFAALAAQFDALLCHDSGPMHIAAAVGTPVVALFGSQNLALWRPAGDRHRLLQPPLPCRECVAPGVCVPADSYRSYCVRRLTVEEVYAAIRDLLTGPGSNPPWPSPP
ncbi:MAG TPA: glycosyltransferase family 9 protein [Opitutaceae bacterium]|nr:glycosyltransferase family 9 protein [Opitutaceae bacterium]